FARVDYIGVRNTETLEETRDSLGARRVLAAAWLGQTRLIDNVAA
ncbi:MAG: pantoate--beta-alanine ligase, partial [Pseudomonadota bacterium]